MKVEMKQISALEKVRTGQKADFEEVHQKSAFAGERVSYQVCITSQEGLFADISVQSPLKEHIRLYQVRDAYADAPLTEKGAAQEDYITLEACAMPDILVPLEETWGRISVQTVPGTIWVRADIPSDTPAGVYEIELLCKLTDFYGNVVGTVNSKMTLKVVPAVMPQQRLIYTRWFYADCIASVHHTEIFSERHWELMEKYIAAAVDVGINMILVPTHTPPLDTAVGTQRPCVQLVDIQKEGDTYLFGFDKFRRFIGICKKCGVKYYEIAHLFSQWGAEFSPNIMVTEHGEKTYQFGWHVKADSEEYVSFLKQYLAAIAEELEKEGISENTYFHISDEPSEWNVDKYKAAYDIIRPLIGSSKTFDALSNYIFYEKGLVECPVTSVDHIQSFLEHDIPNQWVYYCCIPQHTYTNCFMVSPSYRTRILGFLLYKYDIKGFLHWGFNFYHARLSMYPIDPYLTTSADKAFPSGDPFIVYPAENGVYASIRGETTYDAIQDMNICFALEEKLGRDKVVQMIDEAAGGELRFDDYPKNNAFLDQLREKMTAYFE